MAYPSHNMIGALSNAPGVPLWKPRQIHEIHELLIHHAAGPEEQTVEQIHRYHQEKDWGNGARAPRCVYHYLVSPNGAQWKANRSGEVTWHCKGHNRIGLSICLIGNRAIREVPPEQYLSLLELAAAVVREYPIRLDRIHGHREFFPTQCPGQYMNVQRLREDLAKRAFA